MRFIISRKVRAKLADKEPPVTEDEIRECFATRTGTYLKDQREDHQSDPPTLWFISETYYGRKLKVVFILDEDEEGELVKIRTSYEPNKDELRIYYKFSNQL